MPGVRSLRLDPKLPSFTGYSVNDEIPGPSLSRATRLLRILHSFVDLPPAMRAVLQRAAPQRATTLAALRRRLQARRLLSTLPPPSVPQRLAALSLLEGKMDELEATEVLKLKRTIVERTQQLRERRAAILAGAALTEEEAAAPAVVSDETPVPTELEDDLKLYWQKAIMQGVLLHDVEALQSENVPNMLDLHVLAHLADIQLAVKTHKDDALVECDTLHLTLVFRPNEFLEPGFETLECAFDRVKGQLKSTSGLEIKWRDGKAPMIEGSLSFFDMFAKVDDFAQQVEEKAAVTKELLGLIEEVLLHNSISQVRESPEPVASLRMRRGRTLIAPSDYDLSAIR